MSLHFCSNIQMEGHLV